MEQPFAIVRDVTLSSFERMDTAAQSSSADSRYVLSEFIDLLGFYRLLTLTNFLHS